LCELRLLGLPGRDLIVHLQGVLPASVPIVIMTANAHAAHPWVDVNVASCLLKPFDLDTLFACVAAHRRVLS